MKGQVQVPGEAIIAGAPKTSYLFLHENYIAAHTSCSAVPCGPMPPAA